MKHTEKWADVIGIGFGPANIALAIAATELESPLSFKFLERRNSPSWQDEMLLPGSDIQNHPLRDLVTPRNPRSKYTFTNFLFEHNRLFEHLNLPLIHPLRLEYQQYLVWVASHFDHLVNYGSEVVAVKPVRSGLNTEGYEVCDALGHSHYARSVVLAPGRTPLIPEVFASISDERVVHFTQFKSAFEKVRLNSKNPRIAIIGGSQTAVELLLHTSDTIQGNGKTHGITRNFGFRLKDTSPFSDEVYFPQFVETFYNAPPELKARLRNELRPTNYSASDKDVIDALYVKLYQNKILGNKNLELHTLTNVTNANVSENCIELELTNIVNGSKSFAEFDLAVLATGFKDLGNGDGLEPYPSLLKNLASEFDLDLNGLLQLGIDYRVAMRSSSSTQHAPLYLNGLCESSHGMGDAGSLSLLALRSATILRSLEAEILISSNLKSSSETKFEVSLQSIS